MTWTRRARHADALEGRARTHCRPLADSGKIHGQFRLQSQLPCRARSLLPFWQNSSSSYIRHARVELEPNRQGSSRPRSRASFLLTTRPGLLTDGVLMDFPDHFFLPRARAAPSEAGSAAQPRPTTRGPRRAGSGPHRSLGARQREGARWLDGTACRGLAAVWIRWLPT